MPIPTSAEQAREMARQAGGEFGAQEHARPTSGLGAKLPEAPFNPTLGGLTREERDVMRDVFSRAYRDLDDEEENLRKYADPAEYDGEAGLEKARQESAAHGNAVEALEKSLFPGFGATVDLDRQALIRQHWAIQEAIDNDTLREVAVMARELDPDAKTLTIGSSDQGNGYEAINLVNSKGEVLQVDELVWGDDPNALTAEQLDSYCRDLASDRGAHWEDFAERVDKRSDIWEIDLDKAATAGR